MNANAIHGSVSDNRADLIGVAGKNTLNTKLLNCHQSRINIVFKYYDSLILSYELEIIFFKHINELSECFAN